MRFLAEEGHTGDDFGEQESHEGPEFISFGVVVLAMSFGILTRAWLEKFIRLPYTVILLLFGGVIGAVYSEFESPFSPALQNSIDAWLRMDPRVLQIIFLPILIFASAFNAEVHILERRIGQILWLAVPGVIIGTALTATFVKFCFPYGWGWNLALVFGSMVSATDPVAVVALLQQLGVSEKLGTLIEGESLFNDGSAIVIFEVFLEAVEGKERTVGEIIDFGARLALGGPAIGIALGVIASLVLGFVVNDALTEITLTVVMAFSTFALCESTKIKVSGVLGLVLLGVVMSYYGRPRVSSSVLPSLNDFWHILEYFANTTIFFLSGLIVVGVAITRDRNIKGEDWGYLLLLFVALYIIRGIVVLTAYPILRSGEYKITIPQMLVLTHSGLRGAVALILALIVDGVPEISLEERDMVVFMTAGVAVLSLLFNGTTVGMVVRFLKLDRSTEEAQSVFSNACYALELALDHESLELKHDEFLADADWSLAWRYVPVFTPESYWHRLSMGHIDLSNTEVEDIQKFNGVRPNLLNVNSTSSRVLDQAALRRRTFWQTCDEWCRKLLGAEATYTNLPPRLRKPWNKYHKQFRFATAADIVVGDLECFLKSHSIPNNGASAVWEGHLMNNDTHHITDSSTGNREESKQGDDKGKDKIKDKEGTHLTEPTTPASGVSSSSSAKGTTDQFTSPVFNHVHKEVKGDSEQQPMTEASLMEGRLRFLTAVQAQYSRAAKEGTMSSGALRVLMEGTNIAQDRVEKGGCVTTFEDIKENFSPSMYQPVAKYFNWWPARPFFTSTIARKTAFQLELGWNFYVAHRNVDLENILNSDGIHLQLVETICSEINGEAVKAQHKMQDLEMSSPMVSRALKTKFASRLLVQRYGEAAELLATQGHLAEKEEEKLLHSVTQAEINIAFHPTLEPLKPLAEILERMEFLYKLHPEERDRLIESGAAKYAQYVGSVPLMVAGEKGVRRNNNLDVMFGGWYYLARGNVNKVIKTPNGNPKLLTHHKGLLFGITDSMLDVPHHAGYTTQGYSHLVVFDREKLLQEAKSTHRLNEGLWTTVAAHVLRRSPRFHEMSLPRLHHLLDGATVCQGDAVALEPPASQYLDKHNKDAVSTGDNWELELSSERAIIVLYGALISAVAGGLVTHPLGHSDPRKAPLLVEHAWKSSGVKLVLSGDATVLKIDAKKVSHQSIRQEGMEMKRRDSFRTTVRDASFAAAKAGRRWERKATGHHDKGLGINAMQATLHAHNSHISTGVLMLEDNSDHRD